jgi:cell division protein FtsB
VKLVHEIGHRAGAALVPVLAAGAAVYFGYFAIAGEHGLIAHQRLEQSLEQTKALVAESAAERRRLERRVALLKGESLDPDMLEELARHLLGLVHRDDAVILTPD